MQPAGEAVARVQPGQSPAVVSKAEMPALRQVREAAKALFEQGQVEETWEYLLSALESVLLKNRELELLLAKLRRAAVGKTSERVDPRQLSLLFDQLLSEGTPSFDAEAESAEDEALDKEIESAEKEHGKRRKKPRTTAELKTRAIEKQTHKVPVPEAEQKCDRGHQMNQIGVEVTRRLEYVPAHFIEHHYHLDKYACGICKEGVTTAPAPPPVMPRSSAGASLLAHVVVSKFADHTPLHRLNRIYARSGADIPVSTLSDWVMRAGILVRPLIVCLERRVLSAYIVRTDATGLKVLDTSSPENIERGSIWAYVGDDRDVLFRYTPTGAGATGPWAFLAGRTGYIQADAHNVFDRLFNGLVASAKELGCWSHGRRRLVALKDTDCRVAYPVKLIARLYRIEHLADARELTTKDRAELRQQRSVPVLEKLQRWFVATKLSEPPGTELAKAASYAINHWEALTRFVDDGRISPDNNLCEQQLRDIALGRKNYLFAGSHDAASNAAGIYSLTRTCAQYGVPPMPYFTDVFAKLGAGWEQARLEELLPHRWQPTDAVPSTARAP